MREIGKMITQVQDASLGEHRIRDLNDDINKMIRVKKAWEFRIKEVRPFGFQCTARYSRTGGPHA